MLNTEIEFPAINVIQNRHYRSLALIFLSTAPRPDFINSQNITTGETICQNNKLKEKKKKLDYN